MPSTLCNPKLIDDFLAERLTENQRLEFEQHLDTCDACCGALQRQTADITLWDDAKTYLSSSPDASSDRSNQNTSESNALNLDFLAPTDDPHMLGRFAGYEISGVIGCGGMGIVLKGFDSALNRYAAIKVLSPHYASSSAARQRFAREAQAAAAVVHDNVIAIHGVDEFNQLPYLVMPYVKGESLQKRIDRAAPLAVTEILRIASQAAKGLAAAHDQGLVHRDIKPGNILLPAKVERVIITDFGLARAADDASLTRSGVIAGTPQYMSPEQAKGDPIDHRSDLFSLGSVMYAMCTGHPPFRAESPYGILRRITDHEPRPIREINPDIPFWLEGVVNRLLSKKIADRYTSGVEVGSLLEDCLAHVQHPTQVPLPSSIPKPKRKTALLWATAIVGTVAITSTIFWWPTLVDRGKPDQADVRSSVSEDNLPKTSKFQTASDVPAQPNLNESDLQWESFGDLDQLEATINELDQAFADE